jgi:hypothetical protein
VSRGLCLFWKKENVETKIWITPCTYNHVGGLTNIHETTHTHVDGQEDK